MKFSPFVELSILNKFVKRILKRPFFDRDRSKTPWEVTYEKPLKTGIVVKC